MQDSFSPTESERIVARLSVGLVEDSVGTDYDDAVQIAVALFSTPMAYVTLRDEERQWIAAKIGVRAIGQDTSTVFNDYIISSGARLVVEDAKVDSRFANHPSVNGNLHLRFFAGVPLFVDEQIVGTLCVVDTVPRIVDSRKLAALAALGRQVSDILQLRSRTANLAIRESRTANDIEETRSNSALHRLAARRFETLFHDVPIACFTFDDQCMVHEWNSEAEKVFGLPAYDLIDESMYRVLSNGRRSKLAVTSIQHVLAGESVEDVEWAYRRPDGQGRRLLTSAFPLRGSKGQVVGGVCATVDITERKIQERALRKANSDLEGANARLERLASHDGLTGIPNYRAFHERLAVEFANAKRYAQDLCLVLIDVDRFKSLNDTFGHPAGDKILQILARILQESSRKGDFVARYGGEEFALLLPMTSGDVAPHVTERVRRAVADYDWPFRSITISVGYASTADNVATPQELIDQADVALYQSKNEGRNRVTRYQQAS